MRISGKIIGIKCIFHIIIEPAIYAGNIKSANHIIVEFRKNLLLPKLQIIAAELQICGIFRIADIIQPIALLCHRADIASGLLQPPFRL